MKFLPQMLTMARLSLLIAVDKILLSEVTFVKNPCLLFGGDCSFLHFCLKCQRLLLFCKFSSKVELFS